MKFVPLLFTSFLVEIPHAQPTNGLIINQLKHAFSYAFLLPHWLQTPNTTFINSFSLFLSLHNRRQDKQGKKLHFQLPNRAAQMKYSKMMNYTSFAFYSL